MNATLSQFARGLSAETAFDVLAVARRLKAAGKDVVELQIGDSPFSSTKSALAAGKKDCREAARIANDILDRNPDYYYKKVAGSKSVQPCSWYVRDERTRRVTARKAKSSNTGAAAKAKAAPRKEADSEAAAAESAD